MAFPIQEIKEPSISANVAGEITAKRFAKIDWGDIDEALIDLGGFWEIQGGVPVIHPPQSWPGFDWLLVDHIGVTPLGPTLASTWNNGPLFREAELEVSYKLWDWDWETTVIQESIEATQEVLIAPSTVELIELDIGYKSPGEIAQENLPPNINEKKVMRHVRLPQTTYVFKVLFVAVPNVVMLDDRLGDINAEVFPGLGKAVGTVLFDSYSISRDVKLWGVTFSQITMKFIHNKHGWNNTLDPRTLKWRVAVPAPYVLNDIGDALLDYDFIA